MPYDCPKFSRDWDCLARRRGDGDEKCPCPEGCVFDAEWGAWRAVLGHYIHPVIAEWDVCATRDQDEPSLYLILSDSEVFGAVGWSP